MIDDPEALEEAELELAWSRKESARIWTFVDFWLAVLIVAWPAGFLTAAAIVGGC